MYIYTQILALENVQHGAIQDGEIFEVKKTSLILGDGKVVGSQMDKVYVQDMVLPNQF